MGLKILMYVLPAISKALSGLILLQNPRNWSRGKKFFVTFEICLLTTSVYIGSAIYSAGIINVTEVFGVSRVAATLGLTLFVAGYGVGPMLWSPMSEVPQIGRLPVYMLTLLVRRLNSQGPKRC